MTNIEKSRINNLKLIEDQLRTLVNKVDELGWKYNYKEDKELIENVAHISNMVRHLAIDVGTVRADLYLDWNKNYVTH